MARPRQASFSFMGQPPSWIDTTPFADSIRKVGIYPQCVHFVYDHVHSSLKLLYRMPASGRARNGDVAVLEKRAARRN